LHPNQPGWLQLDPELELVGSEEVVVRVGAGAGAGVADEVVEEVVVAVSSLHPNQPGVLHVDVDDELDDVEVLESVVVGSSRHPHHPGVLHVSVRVRLLEEVLVATDEDVLDGSVPLLSKNSHGKQSVQSTYCSHLGG
jgi:hypothetical protein